MQNYNSKIEKGFSQSSQKHKSNNISNRLMDERMKALSVLQKTQNCVCIKKIQDPNTSSDNKENISSDTVAMPPPTQTINISDLVADDTMNLQLTPITTTRTSSKNLGKEDRTLFNNHKKNDKISFEINEITGRSTLYNMKAHFAESSSSSRLSVSDILATSCAPKVRDLRKSLGGTLSANNSTLTSFGEVLSSSLPRTANMSNDTAEKFAPAELMQSKLLSDEISWAQERAVIPIVALSKEARAKINAQTGQINTTTNSISLVNSVLDEDDPNFSLGRYVNMRSENLSSIVNQRSPSEQEQRPPIALVDEASMFEQQKAVTSTTRGDSTAIDALYDHSMTLNTSDEFLADELIKVRISPRSHNNTTTTAKHHRSVQVPIYQASLLENKSIAELCEFLSSNKENIAPISLHDTHSFSESMLNNSNGHKFQNRNASSQQSRSPLSPLLLDYNGIPKIQISNETGHAADVDEWPASPKASQRHVLRKKSPSPKNYHKIKNNSKGHKLLNATKSPPNNSYNGETGKVDHLVLGKKSSSPKKHPSPQPPELSSTRLASLTVKKANDQLFPSNGSNYGNSPNSKVVSNNKNGSDSPSSIVSGGLAVARSTCSCGSPRSELSSGVPARSISRCSSTSEFIPHDGKVVPLKVSSLELSWPSTKLRTNARKSMQVKNTSNKRLVLRIEVIGPGFQILNMTTHNLLTLQSQECRSIKINFCPTITGVANGTLLFYTCNSHSHHFQQQHHNGAFFLEIPLKAYGGHSRVVAQNICKGPVGPSYIVMGDMCDVTRPLERTFQLYNTGSLCGFFSIAIDAFDLQLRGLTNAFTIVPKRTLIHSGSSINVRIIFQPRRDDIRKISKRMSNVLTLAQLRIISGDEANRQRMRRIYRILPAEERAKLSIQLSEELWSVWPEEKNLDGELNDFQEAPETLMDLMNYLKVHEIALTITRDDHLDDSLAAPENSSLHYADGDETVLFHTVCAPKAVNDHNAVTSTTHNMGETCEGILEETAAEETGVWYVKPSVLNFDFYAHRRPTNHVSLYVHNSYKSCQYYEVSCNQKHLLFCTPSEGYISPDGGQVEIVIKSNYQTPPAKLIQEPILITVYMENEHITIPVKIPDDNYF